MGAGADADPFLFPAHGHMRDLLVYYAGDIGDNAFHMVGLVTEPVLQGLGIKHIVMRDPAKVKQDIAGAVTLANSSKRPVALLLTRAVL